MKLKTAVRVALGAGVLFAAAPVFASGSPHFIGSATSASLSGSSLVVSFKEAGLSAGSTETIVTSGTASVTYECVNGGHKNPSASNKTTTSSAVSTSGTFTVHKNGNLVGQETTSVPSAASLGFSCPPGQTVTLVSVTYSDITLTDTTSGATDSLGTLSYSNPTAP
ncbi:MAG: hypothetical protein ACYCTI_04155 [Acidimicrobiales bacterium]